MKRTNREDTIEDLNFSGYENFVMPGKLFYWKCDDDDILKKIFGLIMQIIVIYRFCGLIQKYWTVQTYDQRLTLMTYMY